MYVTVSGYAYIGNHKKLVTLSIMSTIKSFVFGRTDNYFLML